MERGAAKLAKLRLTQTDAAPFPAPRTDVTARSTGFKSNGHFKSNGNFKSELQLQLQLLLLLQRPLQPPPHHSPQITASIKNGPFLPTAARNASANPSAVSTRTASTPIPCASLTQSSAG